VLQLPQPGSRAIAAPPGETTTPNYSLNHARPGSDNLTASTYPLLYRPRRSGPLAIIPLSHFHGVSRAGGPKRQLTRPRELPNYAEVIYDVRSCGSGCGLEKPTNCESDHTFISQKPFFLDSFRISDNPRFGPLMTTSASLVTDVHRSGSPSSKS
jgi:hypothetical protein